MVLRYCRGVDRCDFDVIRSAYYPDGLDHHTGFDGTVGEYLPWLQRLLPKLDGAMHMMHRLQARLRMTTGVDPVSAPS